MRWVAIAATVAVAGCAMATDITPRPPEGYPALRINQTVRLDGALGNTWEFPAGTVLVADRTRQKDGATLYCGPMVIRDIGSETRQICHRFEGGKLYVNAEYLDQGFERDLPSGSVEEIRVR